MAADNQISIEISPEDLEKIRTAIQSLEETLKPYLTTLTVDERREIPKMSDKTLPFVQKTLDYAQSNSEFAPAYLKIAELKKDVEAVNQLTQIFRPLAQLSESLNDSIMLAGSEAYIAALAYYNTVKQAVKMNVPAAETIHNDLSQRFPGRRRRNSSEE